MGPQDVGCGPEGRINVGLAFCHGPGKPLLCGDWRGQRKQKTAQFNASFARLEGTHCPWCPQRTPAVRLFQFADSSYKSLVYVLK